MTETPWGDSQGLRARRLAPGWGAGPAEVARSQRERIFAAMVALSTARGYEATSIADLLELSGVSRKAFYEHFANKQECFLATLREILERSARAIVPLSDGRGTALAAFTELITSQPAASRMCFVESFAAGPEAVALIDQAVAGFEGLYAQAFDARDGEQRMAPELVVAIVGGLRKVIYTRLRLGREAELRGLAEDLGRWSLGYEAPTHAIERQVRPAPNWERAPVRSPRERIIAAAGDLISERGFPKASVRGIIARASTSSETFYKHFDGKEDVFAAALDAGGERLGATIRDAYDGETRWPDAVRASLEAICDFLAQERAFAQLALVAILTGTTSVLDRRDRGIGSLQRFLEPGYEEAPQTPAIAAEAIGGAIWELIYRRVRAGGAESLGEAAPLLTYLALAPFLGAEEACAVANGGG
jgi:AcrR family transcriptional regulator